MLGSQHTSATAPVQLEQKGMQLSIGCIVGGSDRTLARRDWESPDTYRMWVSFFRRSQLFADVRRKAKDRQCPAEYLRGQLMHSSTCAPLVPPRFAFLPSESSTLFLPYSARPFASSAKKRC